ncbi:glycosyltransferase family 2 protein, partial [Actinocorallia lasiicapitis]
AVTPPRRPQPVRRPVRPQGPVSKLLPAPPDDVEKYSYVRRNLPVLIVGSLASFGCLLVTQIKLVESRPWAWALVPVLAFTILYYVVSYTLNLFTRSFDLAAHDRLVAGWKPQRYPSVDVFLPVCGEPIEVLHNTWTHVAAMARHYPGRVVPFVLDDGDSPELRAMAHDFGFRYAVRPDRGALKKAGNLRYGFDHSDGDHILILDADFSPRADLLDEVVPRLDLDPGIGIVQTPQFFRVLDEQTWIERGAAAVQEYFYRLVQVSRDRTGGAICVGTCAVYRRSALDEIGGFTEIDHSEDIHTGFDLNRAGYTLRYLPIALATGVCPDNVESFYSQQYRWCLGSIDLLFGRKFWTMRMRPVVRASFLSGMLYYLHTALFVVVGPLVPVVMLAVDPGLFQLGQVWWLLPVVGFGLVVFPAWHRVPYRLEALSVAMLYSWTHLFTFYDALRGREMGWKPSGSGSAANTRARRLRLAMFCWSVPVALVWVALAGWRSLTQDPADVAFVLGLGLFNLFVVARTVIEPK